MQKRAKYRDFWYCDSFFSIHVSVWVSPVNVLLMLHQESQVVRAWEIISSIFFARALSVWQNPSGNNTERWNSQCFISKTSGNHLQPKQSWEQIKAKFSGRGAWCGKHWVVITREKPWGTGQHRTGAQSRGAPWQTASRPSQGRNVCVHKCGTETMKPFEVCLR